MISDRLQWSDRYLSLVTFLLLTIEKHSKGLTRCKFTRAWHPSESFRHAIATLFFAPSRSRPYTLPRVASADLQTEWPGRVGIRMRMTEIAPVIGRGVSCGRRRLERFEHSTTFSRTRRRKDRRLDFRYNYEKAYISISTFLDLSYTVELSVHPTLGTIDPITRTQAWLLSQSLPVKPLRESKTRLVQQSRHDLRKPQSKCQRDELRDEIVDLKTKRPSVWQGHQIDPVRNNSNVSFADPAACCVQPITQSPEHWTQNKVESVRDSSEVLAEASLEKALEPRDVWYGEDDEDRCPEAEEPPEVPERLWLEERQVVPSWGLPEVWQIVCDGWDAAKVEGKEEQQVGEPRVVLPCRLKSSR
jgi:hypothetical protein